MLRMTNGLSLCMERPSYMKYDYGLNKPNVIKEAPTKITTTLELELLREDFPELFKLLDMVDYPYLEGLKAELKEYT